MKMQPEVFSEQVSPILSEQSAGEITLYPEKNRFQEILYSLLCLLGIIAVWLPWYRLLR